MDTKRLYYQLMKRIELFFMAILVPVDYVCLFAAAVVAYRLRFEALADYRPIIFALPFDSYVRIASLASLGWIIIFSIAGLYTVGGRRKRLEEFKKIVLACSTGFAGLLAVIFFSRDLFASRFIVLAAWVLSILFVTVGRFIIRGIEHSLYRWGRYRARAVVIGHGKSADMLEHEFRQNWKWGVQVVRRFDHWSDGSRADIKKLLPLDRIYYGGDESDTESIRTLMECAEDYHITVHYAADLFSTHAANLEFLTVAGIPLIEVKRTRLDGWGKVYKRIFDIVGSIVLIILTCPIMLLAAIAIKLDSRGPVFFRHERVGQEGTPFTHMKFRSMKPGMHEMRYKELAHLDIRKGPLVKFRDADDPRITAVGRVIRKWSIDELPELFLVLRGTMSLVGPRPHHIEEVARYERRHKKVLTIKPGITGLAQISGRADLSFDQEVQLDGYYIDHWSLKLDVIILLKTIGVALSRKGAY